eukprot:CFRG5948T1
MTERNAANGIHSSDKATSQNEIISVQENIEKPVAMAEQSQPKKTEESDYKDQIPEDNNDEIRQRYGKMPACVLLAPNGQQIRRQKRKLDGPKRPMPAFTMYCKEMRPVYNVEHPEVTFLETTKRLSAKWNVLPAAKKLPYQEKADMAMTNYRRDMDAFKSTITYPCGTCSTIVGENDEAIMCEYGCCSWFHRTCAQLSSEAFSQVATCHEAVWMCESCFAKNLLRPQRNST